MIYLFTGLPGNGKTLFALNWIKAFAEKSPRRKVYQSGIKDLTLPWELFGGESNDPEKPHETDASKWFDLPKASIIVVDEAQRLWRPRGTGSQVPPHTAKLETHRHNGYDLFLITQHPNLLDANVRRLVGTHFHVVRKLGMQYATVHEWSSCTEISPASITQAVKHEFRYPKEAYGWYKSAEVHTHKRRIPARVWFMVSAPVIVAALFWFGWQYSGRLMHPDVLKGAQSISGQKVESKGAAGAVSGAVSSAKDILHSISREDYAKQFVPRVQGLAYSAPLYDEVTKVTRAPVPTSCVSSATRCQCWSQDATLLAQVPEDMCRGIVKYGLFVAFAPSPYDRSALSRSGNGPAENQGASAERSAPAVASHVSYAAASPPPGPAGGSTAKGQGAAETLPPRSSGLYGSGATGASGASGPAQGGVQHVNGGRPSQQGK